MFCDWFCKEGQETEEGTGWRCKRNEISARGRKKKVRAAFLRISQWGDIREPKMKRLRLQNIYEVLKATWPNCVPQNKEHHLSSAPRRQSSRLGWLIMSYSVHWCDLVPHLYPLRKASPLETGISPVSILNVVVLPAPLIPSNPKHWGTQRGRGGGRPQLENEHLKCCT